MMLLGPHKQLIELMKANQENEAIDALAKLERVDCKDRNGNNLLHHAQNHNLFHLARELLIRQPNLRTQANLTKHSPLHDAAAENKCDFLDLYLNLHIGFVPYPCEALDCRAEKDRSALHLAAIKGHEDAVKLLLQAQANVFARDDGNYTPCDYAVVLGHTAIASLLQQKMLPTLFEKLAIEVVKQSEIASAQGRASTLPESVLEQAKQVVCIQRGNKEQEQRKEKKVTESRSLIRSIHKLTNI